MRYESNGKVETLGLKDFENLTENDSSDGEVAKHYKLKEDHLYCIGPTRQRVIYAVQLFSKTNSNGFLMMGERGKAWIVDVVNSWFDVMDSKLKFHKSNKNKCGLGIHEDLQIKSLNSMIHLMENIRFDGKSKPFMKGVVCSTKSVLALYKELKEEGGHQHYLCTYQLNQDPLELFFAQIRSLGGSNNHPRAADFCSRFRTLVMCSNSQTDNILSPNTNVTPDTEVVDHRWNAFSALEEGGEDLSNVDNDGFLEKNEVDELEYELPGRTDRDAVEYLTGYLARKVCFD